MNKRSLTVGLAALATAVGVWLALFGLPGGRLDYAAFAHHYDYNGDTTPDFHLSIDKIKDTVTIGTQSVQTFCDPVDTGSVEAVGTDHQLAVCMEDPPTNPSANGIGAFAFHIHYDPTLDSCADIANAGFAIDDNPDANAGTTVWPAYPTGDNLGGGWDCSGVGLAYPECSKAGAGVASMGCLSLNGPWTLGDNENNGVLAVLNLHVLAPGVDNVSISDAVVGDSTGAEIGSCNPAVAVPVPCEGATDVKDYKPDLKVTKTCPAAAVLIGDSVTCSITVQNIGRGPAYATTLLDGEYPIGATSLNFTAFTGPAGCVLVPGVGGYLSCALDTMAAGASVGPITVTATAMGPEGTNYNAAQVAVGQGLPDADPTNNAAVTPISEYLPDLTVTKLDTTTGLPGSPANGWSMTLKSGACPGGATIDTKTTAGSGTATFANLVPGQYCVVEDLASHANYDQVDCTTNAKVTGNTKDVTVGALPAVQSLNVCNKKGFFGDASDEGVANPAAVDVAVGHSTTLTVTENINITSTSSPAAALLHSWDATATLGKAQVDWVAASGDIETPGGPAVTDNLGWLQFYAAPGMAHTTRDLVIWCVAPGVDVINLSLSFQATNATNVPSLGSFQVVCGPVNEAYDKGASADPATISLGTGGEGLSTVSEVVYVVNAAPSGAMMHTWTATATGNVQVGWDSHPWSTTGGSDSITFVTTGWTNGEERTLTQPLYVLCTGDGGGSVDISMDMDAGTGTTVSTTSLIVNCASGKLTKSPATANLWLCQGPDCRDINGPIDGRGQLVINESVSGITGDSLGAGAFEFDVKFDNHIFDVSVAPTTWLGSTGRVVNCDSTIILENDIRFACTSTGTGPGPTASDIIATVTLTPKADLVNRLTPGQNNGVVSNILDEGCEIANILGDPIAGALPGGQIPCSDSTVTVRILEGDLNLDCAVNIIDDQMIAYRYGASFGNLLYDPWYDLQPALKDYDIDIKDLQKVFGRNGSTCSSPIPPQDPLPPASSPSE